MAGSYFVFHLRVVLHYVLALFWVPWMISTIFVFVEEDQYGRIYTGISIAIYTVIVSFWIFIDLATFKRKVHWAWTLVEIFTMCILGSSTLVLLKYGPYTGPTYFSDDSLAPNAFENAFLIFDAALYLAGGVFCTCLALILLSLWAILFRPKRWHEHFANSEDLDNGNEDEKQGTKRSKEYMHIDETTSLHRSDSSPYFPRQVTRMRTYDEVGRTLIDLIGDSSISVFLGEKRKEKSCEDIMTDFTQFFHQRTAFRKHVFEHWGLSIFRGTLAVYAIIGLVLYFAELSYSAIDAGAEISVSTYPHAPTTGFGNVTIAATQLWPSNMINYLQNSATGPLPSNLSASVFAADGSNATCQFWDSPLSNAFQARNIALLDCNFNPHQHNGSLDSERLIIELQISYNGYPSNTSANDIYSSLAIWLLSSPTTQTLQHRVSEVHTQMSACNAYKLPPGFTSSALVSLSVLEYGADRWTSYNIEQPTVTSTTNITLSSMLTLRIDSSQTLFLKQKFKGGFVLEALQVIGSLGGVFTVVSGVFSIVFGRELLVIITGGWSLSPIGLLGLFDFMRKSFRRNINYYFPELKAEINGKGMAAFLTEVAIDVTLIKSEEDGTEHTGTQNPESPDIDI